MRTSVIVLTALVLSLIGIPSAQAQAALAERESGWGDRNVVGLPGEGGDDEASDIPQSVQVVNFPETQNVAGAVEVTNLPAVQPVTGSVGVSNFPSLFPVSGAVAVTNLPDTQNVNGTVDVGNFPAVQQVGGSVEVSNLPPVQAVSGTVHVGNLPAVQPVTGAVEVTNLGDVQMSGAVEVTNFPTEQQVSGTVEVGNLPATQEVTGSVTIENLPGVQQVEVVNQSCCQDRPFRLVGSTMQTTNGGAGFFGMSALCASEFNGSRMCLLNEALQTLNPPSDLAHESWIDPGMEPRNEITSCGGWIYMSSGFRGRVLRSNGRYPNIPCDSQLPVACCAPSTN